MPNIPTYDSPKVKTAAVPGVRQSINAPIEAFGGGTGLDKAAKNLSAAADFQVKRQEEDDKAAVWKAYSELSDYERQYLYGDGGELTKQNAGAIGGTQRTAKDVGEYASKVSGTLQNDRQKRLFEQMYQRRMDSTLDGVARYESGQRQRYRDLQADGVVKSAQQDASLRWNDPKYINDSAELAETALVGKLRNNGAPQEVIDVETANLRSGIWKAALERAIKDNPIKAEQMFKENMKHLTGDDIGELTDMMKKPLLNANASAIVDRVFQNRSGFDALANAVMQQESGGKRYAKDGKLLTSPKGAEGEMQVMPGTQADPGYGVKPAKDNSPEEKARVGRDYLSAMLREYGGNRTLALAAYNAGPGQVDKWLKTIGDPRKGGISDRQWAESIPFAETKQYVGNIMGSVSRNRSTGSLTDMIEAARAVAGDNEDLKQAAVAEVTRRYTLQKQMERDERDNALENVYGHVLQTGTYAGADPGDLQKLDNKTLLSLRNGVAKQSSTESLMEIYGMTDKQLSDSDPKKYVASLTPADFKQYLQARKTALGGNPDKNITSVRNANSIAVGTMESVGIVTSGKDKQTEKVDMFYRSFQAELTQFEQNKGSKANADEMQKIADKMAERVVFDPDGLFNGVNKRRFEFSLNDVPANVQSAVRKEAATEEGRAKISALLGRPVREVTDQIIIELYTMREMTKWNGKVEKR